MSFKENGFEVVRGKFGKELVDCIATQFRIIRDGCSAALGDIDFGDNLIKKSFSMYSPIFSEALMLSLHKDYEKILERELYPCYSYARIMYKGASMRKHQDRASCQYSVTICISEDIPYPIFIEDKKNVEHEVHLNPGDVLFYNGTRLQHWRNEYEGKEHIQAFVHYVDANGPFKDYKFDKRPYLGLPLSTRK